MTEAKTVPSIALQSKRPKLSSNSTGTLFINDTIRNPDVEELLHCLSVKLHERIEDNSNCGEKESIFNEQEYPLTVCFPFPVLITHPLV
mmetsp:Transcript_18618/g.23595  ORF Transcript_18618/g.23595 Transcript_18618/m.23595 type:complete len:89 (+) Transcript_18618:22-288(+)